MEPLNPRKRKEPACSSTIRSKLDEQQAKLQKACEEKRASDIASIVDDFGSLATQKVTTVHEDGKTTIAFPISYLLMCDDAEPAWEFFMEDEASQHADHNIVRLVEAMWPSQLVQGDSCALPLPLACQNPSISSATIQFLIDTCPTAVTIPYEDGEDGVFPIHLYLKRRNPTLKMVELFCRIHPRSIVEKGSGMNCLNICLQNPTCSEEIWRFLLDKYLAAGGHKSFTLKRQDGMAEGATIDLSKLQQLEHLVEHTEEFTCEVDTIHLDALFGLCTTLSNLEKLRRLVLVVPDGYAQDMPNYTKWGLVNIIRNKNRRLNHLHIDATDSELEIQPDHLTEVLQANTHPGSLTINAKLAGCGENVKQRIEEILPPTLEVLQVGPNGENFRLQSRGVVDEHK